MTNAQCAMRTVCWTVVIVFWLGGRSGAQDVWTLTSSDFTEQRVAVLSINDAGINVRGATGRTREIAWQQVLELDRGLSRTGNRTAGRILELLDGDRITGEPVGLADEQLEWATPWGPMKVPLKRIRAITSGGAEAGAGGQQDMVQLRNGDVVRGVIASIDQQVVGIVSGADSTSLAWDTIDAVQFAKLATAAPQPRRAFRVSLAGDTRLTVDRVATAGEQIQLISDAVTRTIPLGSVIAIEQLNGPVTWLTALEPSQVLYEPYFAKLSLTPRFNQTLTGQPMRVGERTARAGLSAASHSIITYRIPAGFSAFRTQFGLDGNLPYANCIVRILLDGKVAYEMLDVTASAPIQLVTLPLGGASAISLEVDYGKSLDVQDRVNFLEPGLLRELPTTRP